MKALFFPAIIGLSLSLSTSSLLAQSVSMQEGLSFNRATEADQDPTIKSRCALTVGMIMCPEVYSPTTCTLHGASFHGTNLCRAMANVKLFACEAAIDFHSSEVVCSADAIESDETGKL